MASSVGIHIGTESLEVVQLGGSFSRPNLINFSSTKLPTESTWRDLVRMEGPIGGDPSPFSSAAKDSYEAVVNSIRSALTRMGIPNPRAHIAVALESVVVRYFQMPAIPPHERRSAIAFEAKKYLPFKLEELITDYQVVSRRNDPTVMRVMFFGIKRTALTTYTHLLQAASVMPLSLEPASMSLLRLVRQNGQLPSGQVGVVLSLECDTATISVARDDLLYLSRNVTILSTTPEGAEGPSNELLDALVTETRVSVDYYRRRFLGEPPVGKVILFSKGIDSKRISDFSHVLDMPVEMGQPFRKILGAKNLTEGFWAAAGLALRGLERKPKVINLLSPDQRAGKQDFLKPALLEGIATLILLGIWFSVSAEDLQKMEQKIASVRASATLPAGIDPSSTIPQLKEIQNSLLKQTRFLKSVAPQEASASKLFYEAANLLPAEAWLNWTTFAENISEEPEEVQGSPRRRIFQLQGSTFTGNRDLELEKINTFLAKLRENPIFKAIFSHFSLDSVQRIKFQSQDTTDFALTFATRPEDAHLGPQRGRKPQP